MNELMTPETALLDGDGFEVAPQQARLWRALQEQQPSQRRRRVQVHVPGDSNPLQLKDALLAVVGRHEILRTRLREVGALTLPLQFIDKQATMGWNTSGALAHPLSVTLEPAGDHILLSLDVDATLLDGKCVLELLDQWAAACRDAEYGESPSLEAPLQYADYAAWRGELIADDGPGRLFWSERLQLALPAPLPLRTTSGAPREAAGSQRQRLELDDELQTALECLTRCTGKTQAAVLLAAWIALLYRHSASESLALAVEWPLTQPELAGALGVFAEPLPLVAQNLTNVGFDDLCRQVEADLNLLHDYRNSFPSTAAPTLPAGFRYLDAEAGYERQAMKWRVHQLAQPLTVTLQLSFERIDGQSALYLDYAPAVYNEAAANCLSRQLRTLLLAAAADSQCLLTQWVLTSPDERAALERWSSADLLTDQQTQAYARVATLPHLGQCLAASLQNRAEEPAVADQQGTLSFAALQHQSNRLARRLLEHGMQPGQAVAHCLPRDRRAVIALLAILKAGGVYVPVDPLYPAQRIEHILRDSEAGWLLSTRDSAPDLSDDLRSNLTLVLVDDRETNDIDDSLPWADARPADTAYIIYTSGSTGQPKGVPISHAAALHSLAARLAFYPEPLQRYLLLSSFAFDSSIAGLFWTLATGACLHIADASQQKDPQALRDLILTHGVSHLLALPSLHGLLLEQLDEAPPSLRAVIVAGERCSQTLVHQHQQRLPQCALYNEYGPTEAAVWSTVQRCDTLALDREWQGVPIGRPIPGARVWVLDEQLRPVPAGISGELCIAGPGLSAGYLQRPDLTRDKFVQVPTLNHQRVYRSGDRACFDECGRLIFQGRQDGQVKIRGHRVELGEIEHALNVALSSSNAPSKGQSIVLTEETLQGPRLRAFVAGVASVDTGALLADLRQQLPDYMMPADIQVVAQFPRTANGKLDGKALLAQAGSTKRPEWRAPVAGTGQVIAALWEELLQVHDVGLDDDFFALGGHSLLVAQLVHRMQQVLGQTVPVATVFQNPRLGDLIEQLTSDGSSLLAPLRVGRGDVQLLCCDPGDALHHYLPLVRPLPPHIHVQGLVLPVGTTPAGVTLTQLAHGYAHEIRSQSLPGPLFLCGWSLGGLLALETARQLELLDIPVAGVILLDSTFRPHNDSLTFDALRALVRDELSPIGQMQFDALDNTALEALRSAAAKGDRMEQLQQALLTWVPQQGLYTTAPQAVIARELRSMGRARQWLASHVIRAPRAAVYGFWAEQTLQREAHLPQDWQRLYLPQLQWQILPGDHDSLLTAAELQRQLTGTLV